MPEAPNALYLAPVHRQTSRVPNRSAVRLAACSGLLLSLAGATAAGATLDDCRLSAGPRVSTLKAQCLELAVPENPAAPEGGDIALFVARVASLSVEPRPDPLVIIAGGPGQSAVDFYLGFRGAFERVRQERDVVLVDQRGTGRSNALQCPDAAALVEGADDARVIREATERCLASLSGDARYYTTSVAVTDLVAVFDALGIGSVNIYGISYGTRVAQHLMRRHPERVRRAILDGVVPPDFVLGPAIALDAQAALLRIYARCAGDPACAERFPAPLAALDELRSRLGETPVDVVIDDPVSGERRVQRLSDIEVAVAVRLMSYSPLTAALLPLYIDSALNEQRYEPLAAQVRLIESSFVEALSIGMHNSVVCTEDAPWFDEAGVDRAALGETYLGTLTFDALATSCDAWPRGVIDDDFKQPLASDIPTLLLSGENDPITPPAYGERAAAGLSRSLHLTGPGQGHGLAPLGCVPRVMAEFLDAEAPLTIDTTCVDKLAVMPFFVDFTGPGR